jgi:putative FmdB family regulatory protein
VTAVAVGASAAPTLTPLPRSSAYHTPAGIISATGETTGGPRTRRLEDMASYDLVCEACGHTFEVVRQGFLRDEDKVCPACGSSDVRQKFSSFLRNLGGAAESDCSADSPFG